MRLRLNQEVVASLLLIGAGVYFLVGSMDYEIGEPLDMGPGYFPMLVSTIMIILGLISLWPALRAGTPIEIPALRPPLFMLGSVLVFAIAIDTLGLLPAIFAAVVVSAIADPTSVAWQTIALAVGLCISAWLLFIVGLQLPIPAFTMGW